MRPLRFIAVTMMMMMTTRLTHKSVRVEREEEASNFHSGSSSILHSSLWFRGHFLSLVLFFFGCYSGQLHSVACNAFVFASIVLQSEGEGHYYEASGGDFNSAEKEEAGKESFSLSH